MCLRRRGAAAAARPLAQAAARGRGLGHATAVLARLHNMLADSVSDMCRTVLAEDRSLVGQPKQVQPVQVELLMVNRVWVLSRLFVVFASTLAVTRVSWGQQGFTATILSFVTAMSFACLSIARSIVGQPLSCDSLERFEVDSRHLCYTIW